MKSRSWLFVPGNSDKRLGLAVGTGADVVVVDLDSMVPHEEKPRARILAAEWLAAHRRNVLEQRHMGRWVRINSLDSGHSREDLAAIMPGAPEGIILPKAVGPESVRQLASEIYELEQRHGIPANSTRIIPVAGETPLAALRVTDYLESAHQRLHGLTWSSAGLGTSLGTSCSRHEDGEWSDAARFVRAQVLLTAHASSLFALDAPFEDFEDEKGLVKAARRARADGFAGMFALHPEQVRAINEAFTPSDEEIAEARAIVSAFEETPHVGSLPFQGRMVDRSHLGLAQRTISMFENAGGADRRQPILRPA